MHFPQATGVGPIAGIGHHPGIVDRNTTMVIQDLSIHELPYLDPAITKLVIINCPNLAYAIQFGLLIDLPPHIVSVHIKNMALPEVPRVSASVQQLCLDELPFETLAFDKIPTVRRLSMINCTSARLTVGVSACLNEFHMELCDAMPGIVGSSCPWLNKLVLINNCGLRFAKGPFNELRVFCSINNSNLVKLGICYKLEQVGIRNDKQPVAERPDVMSDIDSVEFPKYFAQPENLSDVIEFCLDDAGDFQAAYAYLMNTIVKANTSSQSPQEQYALLERVRTLWPNVAIYVIPTEELEHPIIAPRAHTHDEFCPENVGIELLNNMANHGLAAACYTLGELCVDGKWVKKDNANAQQCFKRTIELAQRSSHLSPEKRTQLHHQATMQLSRIGGQSNEGSIRRDLAALSVVDRDQQSADDAKANAIVSKCIQMGATHAMFKNLSIESIPELPEHVTTLTLDNLAIRSLAGKRFFYVTELQIFNCDHLEGFSGSFPNVHTVRLIGNNGIVIFSGICFPKLKRAQFEDNLNLQLFIGPVNLLSRLRCQNNPKLVIATPLPPCDIDEVICNDVTESYQTLCSMVSKSHPEALLGLAQWHFSGHVVNHDTGQAKALAYDAIVYSFVTTSYSLSQRDALVDAANGLLIKCGVEIEQWQRRSKVDVFIDEMEDEDMQDRS